MNHSYHRTCHRANTQPRDAFRGTIIIKTRVKSFKKFNEKTRRTDKPSALTRCADHNERPEPYTIIRSFLSLSNSSIRYRRIEMIKRLIKLVVCLAWVIYTSLSIPGQEVNGYSRKNPCVNGLAAKLRSRRGILRSEALSCYRESQRKNSRCWQSNGSVPMNIPW